MQMKSIGQDSGKIWNKTSTRLGDALAVSRFDEHGARAAVPLLWDRSVASEASQLCTENSLDVGNFDYVTRFELFLAAFDHGIVHFDRYLAFGSSDEVAIFGPVDQGCDGGSEPPF
jgi:hypothetical protein